MGQLDIFRHLAIQCKMVNEQAGKYVIKIANDDEDLAVENDEIARLITINNKGKLKADLLIQYQLDREQLEELVNYIKENIIKETTDKWDITIYKSKKLKTFSHEEESEEESDEMIAGWN